MIIYLCIVKKEDGMMVCPNCGNVLADNSTNCFSCGAPISNPNVQQSNNTNPPSNTSQNDPMNIAVPQDFVLAGGSDDVVGDDLPGNMMNLLNKDDDKPKKPEKKKHKGKLKKIIKKIFIILVIIAIGIVGYNVYLGYKSPNYDLICKLKNAENGVVVEHINQYTLSDGGYVNSFETLKIYYENLMPLSEKDLDNEMKKLGNIGYNRMGVLEDGKIIITYYWSYYDLKSISDASTVSTTGGYVCEVPKSSGFKLPFFN